jgi:glycine cleavage system H protein
MLDGTPEILNTSPYDDGWLVVIKLSDPKELNGLMDAAAYKAFLTN